MKNCKGKQCESFSDTSHSPECIAEHETAYAANITDKPESHNTISGLLAFLGVWVCFCAIADYVIQFETNSYTMLYEFFAGMISLSTEKWINGS